MRSLHQDVKDRKVLQWMAAYAAVAIGVLEVVGSLSGQFAVSLAVQRGISVVLAGGLFVTLILAWYHGERGAQAVTRTELALLSVVGVVTVTALGFLAPPGGSGLVLGGERTEGEPGSVAVLPCTSFNPAVDSASFGEAVQDEILNHLAHVPGLLPISRTSITALRNTNLTSRQLADSLRALHVLECSYQHAGDRVKVTAQLIEARRDAHVWSEARQFPVGDLFGLQEEIAVWVVDRILAALSREQVLDVHTTPRSPAAQDAYLKAKAWSNSRTREDLARAIDAFEEAVRLDSTFAPAYSSLAFSYALWGTYGYGGDNAGYEAYGRALWLAERAVELDPSLGEAHSTRGYLLSKAYGPPEMVAEAFRQALATLPASAEVRIVYAHFLAREHRFDESIRQAELATQLDPLAPGRYSGMAWDALAAGRPELALRSAREAAKLEPSLMSPKVISALALVLLGRAHDCLELDMSPTEPVRAICLHDAGFESTARSAVFSGDQVPPARRAHQHLAAYHAFLGDGRRALDVLRKGFAETPHGLDFRIIDSPIFAPVHDDPAFIEGIRDLRTSVWERVQAARKAAGGWGRAEDVSRPE